MRISVEGSARIAWYDPERGSWFQTYYDTPATLRAKYVLAHEVEAAGVGIWTLGYDAGLAGYPELVGQDVLAARGRLRDRGPGRWAIPVGASRRTDLSTGSPPRPACGCPTTASPGPPGWIRRGSTRAGDGPLDWTLAAGPDGPRTVHVQSRDLEGELSVPVSAEAFVDRAPPVVEGFSLRPAPVPGWVAQYLATDEGGVATTQVRWQVDAEGWSAWRPLDSLGAGSLLAPPSARVRAELRVTDRAGRTTTAATEATGWEHP